MLQKDATAGIEVRTRRRQTQIGVCGFFLDKRRRRQWLRPKTAGAGRVVSRNSQKRSRKYGEMRRINSIGKAGYLRHVGLLQSVDLPQWRFQAREFCVRVWRGRSEATGSVRGRNRRIGSEECRQASKTHVPGRSKQG